MMEKILLNGIDTALYLIPEAPFWFVPSSEAHRVLERFTRLPEDKEELALAIREVTGRSSVGSVIEAEKILNCLSFPEQTPYSGRGGMALNSLSELWFHLSDRCNLKCAHCLFSNNASRARSIAPGILLKTADEAYFLGCRLICLTGGEPLIYPEIHDIIKKLLSYDGMRVAILSNGFDLKGFIEEIPSELKHRIHLQISFDGPCEYHEKLRGKGSFNKVTESIERLIEAGFSTSAAMAVNESNVNVMQETTALVAQLGLKAIHFQHHFALGEGSNFHILGIKTLTENFAKAFETATSKGVTIDNFDALRSQIFSPAGTRFDLGNAAWESLAVGPDGTIFPTPATVDIAGLAAGNVVDTEGLENIWRKSPLLEQVRNLSLVDQDEMVKDPFHFIIGGGDLDHSLIYSAASSTEPTLEPDPYAGLYRNMINILVDYELKKLPELKSTGILLRMGDIITDCPSSSEVNFTHCNCLLSVGSEPGGRNLVRNFYSERAEIPDELILNPVKFEDSDMEFIPEESRGRMYGCGSPVKDAGLRHGETVVDLGSGTGAECFIAAREVGKKGCVIGLDMTDNMLSLAGSSGKKVRTSLGYDNISFIKSYLEDIPLQDNSVDVMISNCVINLCENKRKVLGEAIRVLKPGGRLVISDVVTETEPLLSIRADHQLAGECIGGAFVQEYLFAILEDMGFVNIRALKRFPYREVKGHAFFSLTYQAFKPGDGAGDSRNAFYAGPFKAVITDGGEVMPRGVVTEIGINSSLLPEAAAENNIFFIDSTDGRVSNVEAESSCSCFISPDETARTQAEEQDCSCFLPTVQEPNTEAEEKPLSKTGCVICGAGLEYTGKDIMAECALCGELKRADAKCENGHFVCDQCHIKGPLEFIKKICVETDATDMLGLMKVIRSSPIVPMHGPEHHAMVPGIILAVYRNLGGEIMDEDILAGIDRGAMVPGGACAFMAVCGSGLGAGIAFSIILKATPLSSIKRNRVQKAVLGILTEISKRKGARCCQRECYLALKEVSRISKDLLGIHLPASETFQCSQSSLSKECIKARCPLFSINSVKSLVTTP